MNFLGTTKRRSINLGGSRKPLKANSYLEQLSQERAKKAKAKQETAAAVTLQAAVRRHFDLKARAAALQSGWNPHHSDPAHALREFAFFSRYIAAAPGDFQTVCTAAHWLQEADLRGVDPQTFKTVFRATTTLFTRMLRDSDDAQLLAQLAAIAAASCALAADAPGLPFREMAADLNEYIARYQGPQSHIAVQALLRICHHDPPALVKFLSLDRAFETLAAVQAHETGLEAASNDAVISELINWTSVNDLDSADLDQLSVFKFLWNLGACLDGSRHRDLSTTNAISAITKWLNLVKADIVFIEDVEDSDGDVAVLDSDTVESIVVDDDLSRSIHQFYTGKFLTAALDELEASAQYQVLTQFLHSSMTVFNTASSRGVNSRLRSEILSKVMFSPKCPEFTAHLLETVTAYQLPGIEYAQQKLASRTDSLLPSSQDWWSSAILLNEILSHILTFQTDRGLARYGGARAFATVASFLKQFCLLISFRGRRLELEQLPVTESEFSHLCDLAFRILRQLYYRDTRIHFVDANFWSVGQGLELSVSNVTKMLEFHRDLNSNDDPENVGSKIWNRFGSSQSRISDEHNGMLLILMYMPFLIPFETRALCFEKLIREDKYRSGFVEFEAKAKGTISRDNVLLDAFNEFADVSTHKFKGRFDVTFVNQFGVESGIDGGGLTKEFLTSVCQEGFRSAKHDDSSTSYGGVTNFFKQTPKAYQLYPNTDFFWEALYQKQQTVANNGKLESRYDFTEELQFSADMMRFLGRVIGKCLYSNVLIDVSFAPFFLSKWCSVENLEGSVPHYRCTFDDLKYYDEDLYESLLKLLEMDDESLASLDLVFNISEKIPHQSKAITADLIPNGSQIAVNGSNKLQYVYSVADFKLNKLIAVQTKNFLAGLFDVISPTWLGLFSHTELQMLVSGGEKPVDVADLRANTSYGGYLETDLTVQLFWEVVEEFTPEERSKLVKFVTSSPKAPLLGFQELDPKFGIRDSLDTTKLPSASTCFNLLKLPDYKDKKLLREKLLYAINAESGFDLS